MKRRQLLQGFGLLPIATLFRYSFGTEKTPLEKATKQISAKPQDQTASLTYKLNGPSPDLTFNNFFIYRESEVAYGMAHKVCSLKSSSPVSPFIITGACGNGTTHLAHAIANELLSQSPHRRVHIVSAERYLNHCIQSARRSEMQNFRKFYRESIDVLIVDDFHYIQRGQFVQEEMIHTLKELQKRGCLVILTADTDIQGLTDLNRNMSDLLNGGVSAHINSPQLNSRKSLLRYFAANYDVALSKNQINILAKECLSVRWIQGQVKKIQLMKELGV